MSNLPETALAVLAHQRAAALDFSQLGNNKRLQLNVINVTWGANSAYYS
jgi:hypothetical protein